MLKLLSIPVIRIRHITLVFWLAYKYIVLEKY